MMPPEPSFFELCRLCLVKDNVSTLIFDRKDDDEAIHAKISACLPVKVKDDDGLPNKICDECVCKLENTYQFRHVAASSEKQLLQWLSDTKSRENPSVNIPSENNGSEKHLVKQEIEKGNDSRNSENENCNEKHESSESDADAVVEPTGKPQNIPQGNAADPTDVTPSLNESLQVVIPAGSVVQQPTFLLVGNSVGVPILQLAPPSLLQPGVPLQLKPCTSGSSDKSVTDSFGNWEPENSEEKALDSPCEELENGSKKKKKKNGSGLKACEFCGKMLPNGKLSVHRRTHTGERPFSCSVCDEAFVSKGALKVHAVTHSDERPYSCDICSRRFKRAFEVKNHKKIHSGEKNHVCDICGYSCVQRTNLVNHRRRHLNEYRHRCNICSKGFYTNSELREHMNGHTGDRPHQCDICGLAFRFRYRLTVHARSHTPEYVPPDKSYSCEICGKSYSRKQVLATHVKSHTGEGRRLCAVCGKVVSSADYLKVHIRTHTGEKPERCDVCGKTFVSKKYLRTHLRTHTGERPYKCARCDKSFTQQSSLNVHKRSSAHCSAVRFTCHCGKAFSADNLLAQHLETHRGSYGQNTEISFQCA